MIKPALNKEMKNKKILLVEDEVDLSDLFKRMLENHGFEVITAYDGQECLQKVNELPDIILLDLMIGKVDGFMICSLLKKSKKYANIPVVIMTARGQQEDQEIGKNIGAAAYLIKPVKFEDLLQTIKPLLTN